MNQSILCLVLFPPEASVSQSSPPAVGDYRLRVRQGDKDVDIPIPVGYLLAVVVFLLASHFSTDRC